MKSCRDLQSPAFDEYPRVDKDGFSALQLVMERGIDLCGFWLEISAGGIWEDPV